MDVRCILVQEHPMGDSRFGQVQSMVIEATYVNTSPGAESTTVTILDRNSGKEYEVREEDWIAAKGSKPPCKSNFPLLSSKLPQSVFNEVDSFLTREDQLSLAKTTRKLESMYKYDKGYRKTAVYDLEFFGKIYSAGGAFNATDATERSYEFILKTGSLNFDLQYQPFYLALTESFDGLTNFGDFFNNDDTEKMAEEIAKKLCALIHFAENDEDVHRLCFRICYIAMKRLARNLRRFRMPWVKEKVRQNTHVALRVINSTVTDRTFIVNCFEHDENFLWLILNDFVDYGYDEGGYEEGEDFKFLVNYVCSGYRGRGRREEIISQVEKIGGIKAIEKLFNMKFKMFVRVETFRKPRDPLESIGLQGVVGKDLSEASKLGGLKAPEFKEEEDFEEDMEGSDGGEGGEGGAGGAGGGVGKRKRGP